MEFKFDLKFNPSTKYNKPLVRSLIKSKESRMRANKNYRNKMKNEIKNVSNTFKIKYKSDETQFVKRGTLLNRTCQI